MDHATIPLFRLKNRVVGKMAPRSVGRRTAQAFLTPRHYPLKDWEEHVEQSCRRLPFGHGLSAASWGDGHPKVLLMHGWESRATQMFNFVPSLLQHGFQAIAIDGPEHGHSNSGKANAVAFADAIHQADTAFGPFWGAIGHSMGAAAIVLAMEAGVHFERIVLIAPPANFLRMMISYADFIGLPKRSTDFFIHYVEKEVGRSSRSLDVGKILAQLKPNALLVHSRDDREVPYKSAIAISRAYPALKLRSLDALGHHKIIRSPAVAALAVDHLDIGAAGTGIDEVQQASAGGRRA